MEHSNLSFEQLSVRVDAILERLTQSVQNQRELRQQVEELRGERDALQARLEAIRSSIDTPLDHLSPSAQAPHSNPQGDAQ